MSVILTPPKTWWKCPSCQTTDVTERADVHSRMHSCPAFNGVTLPMEQVLSPDSQTTSRHRKIEREDYIGDEVGVGRTMSISTDRPDGSNDLVVFAPTAAISVSAEK